MKKVVLILLAAISITACIDPETRNNPKVFNITPEKSQISALSQSLEYKLECDKEWTSTLAFGTWAKISQSDHENGRIVVSASINETPEERSDTLIIRSGNLNLKVPVVQKGINSILSNTDVVLEKQNPKTITLHANGTWVASKVGTNIDWLTMEPSSGASGDCAIKFVAKDDNINKGDRNVMIKFEMGESVFYATVTQKQTDAIIKSRDKFELSNGAQDISIDIQTNVNYEVQITADWITKVGTKALDNSTETFQVSANPVAEPREAEIIFTGGSVTETVHVYQAEADVLVFGQTDFVVPAEGGEYDIELRSNVEYEITWPNVDWLKRTTPGGPRPSAVRVDALSITVESTFKLAPREAVIVVKDKNSDLTANIIVRQEGKDPAFQNENGYGLYNTEGEAMLVYVPKEAQTVVSTKSNVKSFRIQNVATGDFAVFDGIPEKAGLADTFDITVKSNYNQSMRNGVKYPVTVIKADGNKLWLYNENGYGFIVKK